MKELQWISFVRNFLGISMKMMRRGLLLCSESRRQLEFPNMFFSLCLPDEGPTPWRPMILILDNGETNQLGNIEYIGGASHRLSSGSGSSAISSKGWIGSRGCPTRAS